MPPAIYRPAVNRLADQPAILAPVQVVRQFALFAEPLLRTMVFSLQASAAAVPMLQVSLASRDTPESPPPARRGEQSGDDLPLADVPEAVAAESPASAVADPLAGSGIVSALVPWCCPPAMAWPLRLSRPMLAATRF